MLGLNAYFVSSDNINNVDELHCVEMSHLCIILKQEDLSIMYNSRQGEFECGNSQEAAMFLIGSTTASVEFYFQ